MSRLTTVYVVAVLKRLLLRYGDLLHDREKQVIEEAARRVTQHGRLVAEVLPDLRRPIAALEGRLAGRERA